MADDGSASLRGVPFAVIVRIEDIAEVVLQEVCALALLEAYESDELSRRSQTYSEIAITLGKPFGYALDLFCRRRPGPLIVLGMIIPRRWVSSRFIPWVGLMLVEGTIAAIAFQFAIMNHSPKKADFRSSHTPKKGF